MRPLLLVPFVVVVASAGLAPPALAAKAKAKKPAWVVLVHASADAPAWAGKLRTAAEKAQDRNWVDPPAVTLDEAAAVVGCAEWNAACAGQVAGMSDAANALLIELAGKGPVSLTIAGIDATGAPVGESDKLEVSGDEEGLKIAVAFVAGVVKGARPTILVVTSDVDPTEVVLDNVPVGKTPLTLLDGVTAGPHTLLLKREGRAPLTKPITLTAGIVNKEHGVLSANGPPMKTDPVVGTDKVLVTGNEPAPATPDGVPPLVLAGWGMTGGGALVAVGGAVLIPVGLGDMFAMREGGFGQPGSDALAIKLCDEGGGNYSKDTGNCSGTPLDPKTDRFVEDEDGNFVEDPKLKEADLARQNRGSAVAISGGVLIGLGVLLAATGVTLALTTGEEADAGVVAPAAPAPAAPAAATR